MSPLDVSPPPNPFPGLRPFQEEEEYKFFGREKRVDALVNKLGTTRLVAVVGPSGSGKSSLVNCGLRPALHRGLMASAGSSWRMAQFRPGSDPLQAMSQALAKDGVLFTGYAPASLSLEEIVDTTLRLSTRGLIDIYEQAPLGERVNLLVVVDQFEELFRYRKLGTSEAKDEYGPAPEATAFVNLLLEAKHQATCPVYIAITMRSDFLGDCAQFPGLPEAINDGQYLVPRMTREERRAAISGPVRVGGAETAPVLLTRLVNDVGDNPDQLSILQHALNRTWARWQHDGGGQGPLNLPHYEDIGTMAGALDQHAEKAYAELETQRQRKICETIFKALTDKSTDPRGIRRPTKLGTLCALADATKTEVTEVIDVFRKPSRSFLMPPVPEALTAETVIDISHESLMRVWKKLKNWAEEEAQSAKMYRRLTETAALRAADKAGLWGDPDLQLVLDWREREQPTSAWAVQYGGGFDLAMGFLQESQAARDREASAKEERRRRELKRTRFFAVVLGVAFVIAAFLASYAYLLQGEAGRQKVEAVRQKEEADRQRRVADASAEAAREAREETARANKELSKTNAELQTKSEQLEEQRSELQTSNTDLTTALANLEAARAGAESLNETLSNTNAELQTKSEQLEEQSRKLEASNTDLEAARARAVSLRLVSTWQALALQAISDSGSRVDDERTALLARQAWLFHGRRPQQPTHLVEKALQRSVLVRPFSNVVHGHQGPVLSVAFSLDGERLASASFDKTVRLWDLDRPEAKTVVLQGHESYVWSVVFSPDGERLASASHDGTVRLWDLDQPEVEPVVLQGHQGPVRSVAFSPDGERLASASHDRTVRLWDLDRLEAEPVVLQGHQSTVLSVAFSPDGERLASASADQTVRLWDLGRPQAEPPRVLEGHQDNVWSVAFSPDGERLASASEDKTVRLWDLDRPEAEPVVLQGHQDDVFSVAFSPDGERLASASHDLTVRLWDLDRPEAEPVVLQGHQDDVFSVAFSPDGERLASASEDKTVRLWDLDRPEAEPVVLQGNQGPVRSVAFSPDGERLASASEDKTVRLWDLDRPEAEPVVLQAHQDSVLSVAFSPDGRRLASASADQTVRLWDLDRPEAEPRVLEGHQEEVNSVAFSPVGKLLASASDDLTVRLWDLDRPEAEPVVLQGHSDFVKSVTFSPDGKRLASASDDLTVRL